jgi:hemerythrin
MHTGAYDIFNEHQHIRRLVDALEVAIDKRQTGSIEWLDEARPVLIELSSGLLSHFRGEETELFGDITNRLPRHAATVERLIEQHRRLATDFGRTASDATTLDPTHTETVNGFLTVLSKALKLLRAHEEQENELMLIAFWQDLGETAD